MTQITTPKHNTYQKGYYETKIHNNNILNTTYCETIIYSTITINNM